MATVFTVQDCYQTVCWVLLEDTGLALGIVTQANFLTLFADVLLDFVNRTGLVWEIFTQQLNFNQSPYLFPPQINEVKEAFVGGVQLDHTSLPDLDAWLYNWRAFMDIPQYWHEDGLPPKTIELAANPNYTGAGYLMPVDITAQPPYGVFGVFNAAPPIVSSGTVDTSGTAVTWTSGDIFNTGWGAYYPVLNIVIAGVIWPISAVAGTTGLTLAISAGTQSGAAYSVTVPQDGNLTVVGTKGLVTNVFALDDVIPVVPDSFCPALAYGILARIFSQDGEAKDLQRAQYAQARYSEYANAGAAVAGQVLEI